MTKLALDVLFPLLLLSLPPDWRQALTYVRLPTELLISPWKAYELEVETQMLLRSVAFPVPIAMPLDEQQELAVVQSEAPVHEAETFGAVVVLTQAHV